MQLDKKTLAVLNNFGVINPSIMVHPGKELKTVSPTKSIFARVNIDQEFEKGFCVYDLSRFLTTVSLFDEPELEINDDNIVIRRGTNKVNYAMASPNTIITPKDTELVLGESFVNFVLKHETLVQTLKAASVLKLNHIGIEGKDGKILLEAFDHDERIQDRFEIEIGDTNLTFKLVVDIDNFKLIPNDYSVNVHRVSGVNLGVFKSLGEIQVEYVIALHAKSKF